MPNHRDVLFQILDLILKSPNVPTSNMLSGKLLTAVNIIYASELLDNKFLYDHGFDLLEHCANQVLLLKKERMPIDFLNGGIGLLFAIDELVNKNLIKFNNSELIKAVGDSIDHLLTQNRAENGLIDSLSLAIYAKFCSHPPLIGDEIRDVAKKIRNCLSIPKLSNSSGNPHFDFDAPWSIVEHFICCKTDFKVAKQEDLKAWIKKLNKFSSTKADIYSILLNSTRHIQKNRFAKKIAMIVEITIDENSNLTIEDKFITLNQLILLLTGFKSDLIKFYWQFAIISDFELYLPFDQTR